MVKRVRRIVSGQCAIARICGDNSPATSTTTNGTTTPGGDEATTSTSNPLPTHTREMTALLYDEWSKSSKLKPSFDTYAAQPDMPVDVAVEAICKVKKLALSHPCVVNLRLCIIDIGQVNKLKHHMHIQSSVAFDRTNDAHEAQLEQLWQVLLPGVERTGGRFSRDWNRIGFQQSDPASDFRGGGILALEQLLYFATTRTAVARRMIKEPEAEMSRYPWACVGINLTRECLRVLDSRLVDKRLYGVEDLEKGVELVNDVYADMFEVLHHHWVEEEPENVLAFPNVFKKVMADVDTQLTTTGVIVPPGTSA